MLLGQNKTIREIGEIMNIPKSTIARHSKAIGFKSKNKAGRKKMLPPRIVKFCAAELTSRRAKTAVSLLGTLERDHGVSVHKSTLCRALRNSGLKATDKVKKPALSKKNVRERLAFAKSHKDWTVEDWKTVIFSDETKINRFNSDGRSYTWRKDGVSLQTKDVKQTIKGGGGSLMVWGCMTSSGVGYLSEIEGIMNSAMYVEILEKELNDTIAWYELEEAEITFMHDNDPKHKSKLVQSYLEGQQFRVMVWPPQSPDLNPIENLWAHLKRALNTYETPAKGLKELWTRIEVEWEKISKEYITTLFESMPRRMKAVIKSKGSWTKY